MKTLIANMAFQVTDLQRNHRDVIAQARKSGAFIRDKDGLVLLLQPAGDAQHAQYLNDLMADALRMTSALWHHPDKRNPGQYGSLAWAVVLSKESQNEFIQALSNQLLISQHSGSTQELEDLLGDWRATAQAWADDEARNDLLEDLAHPLVDVEL